MNLMQIVNIGGLPFYKGLRSKSFRERMKSAYAIVLILIAVWSCQESVNNKISTTATANAKGFEKSSGLAVAPDLENVDSLQILYYDDPDGDSLRYARYYKHTVTSDSSLINALLRNLGTPFDKRNDIRDCRSEGKIFLFRNGDPLKTVYFSTRCNTCCYLYFIQDGEFLYFEISSEMIEALHRNKPDK